MPGKIGVSASFADIDNDGDADLYVTTVRGGNMLFENDGHGHFRDISAASGLNYIGHSSGAVFFDYDHDGLLDLFLVNVGRYTTDTVGGDGYKYFVAFEDAFSGHLHPERAEPSVLYRNDGGNHFVDVSQQMGLRDLSWSGDASAIDANDDGWPDLYLLNMQGDDQYYENVGGKRFVKKSRELFPRTSWGAMGIKAFDFNNDGRLDIFITDMHSDMSAMTGPGARPHEVGHEVARVVPRHRQDEHLGQHVLPEGRAGQVSRGLGRARPRELLPVGTERRRSQRRRLPGCLHRVRHELPVPLHGQFGEAQRSRQAIRRRRVRARRRAAQGRRRHPVVRAGRLGQRQGPSGRRRRDRTVAIWGARGSRSSAIFDVDGDGDLDIVTNEFNAAPMVLVSNLTEKTQVHYLEVELTGTTSNRNGLGAIVKVTAGGKTYTQVMDGNSGYLSHSVYPLYFGLGSAQRAIDGSRSLWPSGRRQTVPAPSAINSRIAGARAVERRPGLQRPAADNRSANRQAPGLPGPAAVLYLR